MLIRKSLSFHTILPRVTLILVAGSAATLLSPIVTSYVRLLYVISGIMTFMTICSLIIRYRPRAFFWIISVIVLVGLWGWLGSSAVDQQSLRSAYVRELSLFQGTPFVWGGETRHGIDCSGLARTALWRAMLKEGIQHRNPRLLGPMLWKFWWKDLSANSILSNPYGYTRIIGHCESLSEPNSLKLDHTSLRPGDLAVTDSGEHVMVFLKGGIWIEASPADWKVVANPVEGSTRGYFNMPVTLLRWWMFE